MWQKTKQIYAYKGWRSIIKKYFIMSSGQEADFDIVENGDFVTIAAFTTNKEAILTKQFRPGPEIAMVSFAEGYIDKNETPEQAARRELLEETGYEADDIIFLREMRTAYSTERKYCFLATNCQKISVQSLDNEEDIACFTMPMSEFRDYIKDPKIDNFRNTAAAYLALERLL